MEEYAGTPALDAGLLASAQAVEHYEIVRYGTLKSWAAKLSMASAVRLLDQTLAEEKKTDDTLSQPKSDIRLFFHTALTREAARSRPARLWSHLLNTSATTLRRYSLNILKELGKV